MLKSIPFGSYCQAFLTKHSQKSLEPPTSLEVALSHLRAFEELSFLPVPLGKDKNDGILYNLTKWKELNTIEDVRKAVEKLYDKGSQVWGWAIRTGGVSSLVVIDVDDEEKFRQFLEEKGFTLEEVQECAFLIVRSKSGKGRHYYFRVSKDFADGVQSGQYQKYGFDIKAKDGIIDFVVWTRGGVQLCQVEEFKEVDNDNMMAFLLPFVNSIQPQTGDITHRELETFYEIEEKPTLLLLDVVKKAYESGELDGWTIDANVVLWLVRKGAGDEEIRRALQYVYGSRYSERTTSYMIERVRRLSDSLPYFRTFIDLLRREGFIKKRTTQQDSFWVVEGGMIKKIKPTKDGKLKVEKSLPFAVYVLKKIKTEDGAIAVCRYEDRIVYIPSGASRQEVNKVLDQWISSKQYEVFCEYLTETIAKNPSIATEKAYSSFGWDREAFIFKHPARANQNWLKIKLLEVKLEDFEEPSYSNALEFIKAQIEKGTLFSAVYVMAMASLLIKLRPTFTPFSVFLVGGSHMGKTTSCRIIQNAFLPTNFDMNTNTTKNSVELTLSKLNNIPVLFDELAVSSQDEENLVFQISLGKGRARANVRLEVRVNDISSVVVWTGERRPTFTRQGAFRRALIIPILTETDLFGVPPGDVPFAVKMEEWGHGLVIAEYLEQRLQAEGKEYLKALEEKAKAYITPEAQPFYNILMTAMSMSFVVEESLGVSCEAIRQRILELVGAGVREFRSKLEDVEEALRQWIVGNLNNFVRYVVLHRAEEGEVLVPEIPKGKIYGKIDGEEVCIFKDAFLKFCEEAGLDIELVLKKLEEQGRLMKTSQGKRLHSVSIEGVKASAYKFHLPNREHTPEQRPLPFNEPKPPAPAPEPEPAPKPEPNRAEDGLDDDVSYLTEYF